MKVIATEKGYYGDKIREAGDIFFINDGEKIGKWMEPVEEAEAVAPAPKSGSKPAPKKVETKEAAAPAPAPEEASVM